MSIEALAAQVSSAAPRRQEAPAAAAPAKAAPAPAATAQQSARPAAPPTLDQVKAAAEQIQKYLESSGRSLNFRVDSDTGRVIVSVRDSGGDLIRQIPSEEALELARSLANDDLHLVSAVA